MSNLISAKHLAIRDGFTDRREWIRAKSVGLVQAGMIVNAWNGDESGEPIKARIDFGRLIADCPYCNGAEYVDPDDPVFYCLSCGMVSNDGKALPVEFPENLEAIEAVLSRRPVRKLPYGGVIERALYGQPLVPGLSRSWTPGETVADLVRQNQAAGIDKENE